MSKAGSVLIVAALAGLGWVLFWPRAPEGVAAEDPARAGATPVIVAIAREETFADRIEALGTTFANESVNVTADSTGRIERIHFEDGEKVAQGSLLVTLDRDEEEATLAAAEMNLTTQRAQYQRLLDLVSRQSAAQTTLDEQTNALKRAEADVNIARVRLEDRRIEAPFSGQLGMRRVSQGALVEPGTEIVTLDDLAVVKLDFSVPETFLASLERGLAVEVASVAYPGREFEGEITTIGTRVDPITRTLSVRAEFLNPDGALKPGMLMTVVLSRNPRQAIAVPEESLLALGEKQFVYRVGAGDKVERIEVSIGARRPGTVEIAHGLAAGDRIVIEGTTRVQPGDAVEIAETRSWGEPGSG